MTYVIGHKNPDTDAIVSAIVWAEFKNKNGLKVTPAYLTAINKETAFVLNKFKVKKPKKISKVKESDKIILVDHNIYKQAVDGAEKAEIIEILDHHYLGDFRTFKPIYCRCEPVGSTSTIISKIFKEKRYKPTKKQASLLLAGIISDTLFLTSPTTTDDDKKLLKWLNKFAGINLKKFAQEMFKAKSDISGLSLKEIITKDYKEFEFSGKKFGIGVWETVDVSPFEGKDSKVIKTIKLIKKNKGLNLLFFGLVDIYNKVLYLYLADKYEKNVAKKSFSVETEGKSLVKIKGVVSRKKQMVPPISKNL